MPFDRTGGELLFNLLTYRYERRATVVTSNLAFAEWVTVFAGDEKLTTALLDRLAHHATVLTTKARAIACASAGPARSRRDPVRRQLWARTTSIPAVLVGARRPRPAPAA